MEHLAVLFYYCVTIDSVHFWNWKLLGNVSNKANDEAWDNSTIIPLHENELLFRLWSKLILSESQQKKYNRASSKIIIILPINNSKYSDRFIAKKDFEYYLFNLTH